MIDGLDHSREQKYTFKNDKTINLIKKLYLFITLKQYNFYTETRYVF